MRKRGLHRDYWESIYSYTLLRQETSSRDVVRSLSPINESLILYVRKLSFFFLLAENRYECTCFIRDRLQCISWYKDALYHDAYITCRISRAIRATIKQQCNFHTREQSCEGEKGLLIKSNGRVYRLSAKRDARLARAGPMHARIMRSKVRYLFDDREGSDRPGYSQGYIRPPFTCHSLFPSSSIHPFVCFGHRYPHA